MEMAWSPSLSSSTQNRTSADIYGFHLQQKNLGHPLWKPEPEPHLPQYYRDCGVMIGDVGSQISEAFLSFSIYATHGRTQ